MIRRLALILTAAILLGAAAPDPVKISSDKFEINENQSVATFTGDVVVSRTSLMVWAPRVIVNYGADGPSSIKDFTASGGVRIKTRDQEARGDQAVYNPTTQILRLTGHVMVTNSSGTVGSPDLVINLKTNTTTFTGGKGGRVTGVFTPQ